MTDALGVKFGGNMTLEVTTAVTRPYVDGIMHSCTMTSAFKLQAQLSSRSADLAIHTWRYLSCHQRGHLQLGTSKQ